MKTTYKNLFTLIATILDRIVYAFKMYPTKNPNTDKKWLYTHRIASTAYPDGTKHEYLNGLPINELGRKKVSA